MEGGGCEGCEEGCGEEEGSEMHLGRGGRLVTLMNESDEANVYGKRMAVFENECGFL